MRDKIPSLIQTSDNAPAVRRLAPHERLPALLAKLDEDQMRAAHSLAAEMGLGPVVAALR